MANDTIVVKGLVSDNLTSYFNFYVLGWTNLLMTLFGFASNCINALVFSRQGLTDSVTIAFFFLSLSDLGVNFTNICIGVSIIVYELNQELPADPLAIVYLMCWPHIMFTTMSMYTTVFISVERCLCVLKPLSVKDVITPKRLVVILVIIYIFGSACFIPVYMTMGMSWQHDVTQNKTRLLLWLSPYRPEVELFLNVFVNIVMHTAAHIIVIICAVFMSSGILKSSKFRHNISKGSVSNVHLKQALPKQKLSSRGNFGVSTNNEIIMSSLPAVDSDMTSPKEGEVNKYPPQNSSSATVLHEIGKTQVQLSNKDRKVLKTVSVVVAVFIVCTTPDVWFGISRRFILELDFGRRYSNLHWVLVGVIAIASGLNATMNMAIYLTTSSRYRQVFTKTFRCYCH